MDTNGNGNGRVKVTSLDQLAPRTSDYEIVNSSDGTVFVITLIDLLPDQIAKLDARMKRPKPPVTGFKGKDAYGTPIPVFNEDDPAYIEARENANADYVHLWLLESWQLDYPAGIETAEQKLEAIRKTLPYWALNELSLRLREINGLRMSDVAREKKRSRQTDSDNLNTAPVS